MIKNQYRNAPVASGLKSVGFRKFSQFDEDGILLYIFARIGEGTKQVLEISIGDGRECMAANLLINHGWRGLLFEAGDKSRKLAIEFYKYHLDTYNPPKILDDWITKANVNELIASGGFSGEIDLFSLDVDGNEYWFWQALDVVSPRVVVVESNAVIPHNLSYTSEYKDDFEMDGPYHSASIGALVKLGQKKNYRLVGTNSKGFNLFFMRNDVGVDEFPEISAKQAHDIWCVHENQKISWEGTKDLPWVKV